MKLVKLVVSGFRGFGAEYSFDLDADAVVVVGTNGNGKTSLFDAILWCLSGRVPRIGESDQQLLSLYSETGEARVELKVRSSTEEDFVISRRYDGEETTLSLRCPDGSYEGRSAESRIIEAFWPEASTATDPGDALAAVLTRTSYLQQDLVRHFVEAATDDDRFLAVSELVGAGRVSDLHAAIESEKRNWTRATNQQQADLDLLRQRLILAEARLSEMKTAASHPEIARVRTEWAAWAAAAVAHDVQVDATIPDGQRASEVIDVALKHISSLRLGSERQIQSLAALEKLILPEKPRVDLEQLNAVVLRSRERVESLRRSVSNLQEAASRQRQLQVELKEAHDQLTALAELALRQLGDVCPVCRQEYDRVATRVRLEQLVTASPPVVEVNEGEVNRVAVELSNAEKTLATDEAALRQAEAEQSRWLTAQENVRKQFTELRVSLESEPHHALKQAQHLAVERSERLRQLYGQGEGISLRLAQLTAAARMQETLKEVESLRRDVNEREKDVASRTRTGETAQQIIEALREASAEVVHERLGQIGPVLQSMYARIDPHPSFRSVSLMSRFVRGRGKVSTLIADAVEGKQSSTPSAILSSSQLNALAVCVFLALSMTSERVPLSAALMDDPLQSLDDINLLGLLDLLRRMRGLRQLVVSTHDHRFGQLLSRKLRPAELGGRTIVVELSGWNRRGPTVSTTEIKSDPVSMRLIAS